MKNQFRIYLLFSFLFIFLLTSCSLTDSTCKDGVGEIIAQSRNITGFSSLESRGNFRVNLFQDSSIKEQEITIFAQENIIDLIQTNIVGQSLVIDKDECFNTEEEVLIDVRTPALSQIILAGSGNIVLQDTVRKPQIELVVNGSGNILTTAGFPIITSNCFSNLKGNGSMELDFEATSIVSAAVDGSGILILRGEATENNLSVSGSGAINAFELPVLTSRVELIGSGSIELTANDPDSTLITSRAEVNAQVSGSGTVRIQGNGGIKWNISGSGKIERVD